jgi:hypothetical protein
MTFFSLLESFFFMSLGLSFFLILLMVYHFKKRMDALEKKNETLGDICKTIIQEIESVKNDKSSVFLSPQQMAYPTSQPQYMFGSFPDEGQGPADWNPMEELYKQIHLSQSMQVEEDPPLNLNVYEVEELQDVEDANDVSGSESETDSENGTIEQVNLEETIQVTKLENESDSVSESLPEVETLGIEPTPKYTKKELQKMSVQMLRTIVIRDGVAEDPSKMKKGDLVDSILEHERAPPSSLAIENPNDIESTNDTE